MMPAVDEIVDVTIRNEVEAVVPRPSTSAALSSHLCHAHVTGTACRPSHAA